jgi:hypothetical protein
VYLAADHYLRFDAEAPHEQSLSELLAVLRGGGAAGLAEAYRQRQVSERPLPLMYVPREAELESCAGT